MRYEGFVGGQVIKLRMHMDKRTVRKKINTYCWVSYFILRTWTQWTHCLENILTKPFRFEPYHHKRSIWIEIAGHHSNLTFNKRKQFFLPNRTGHIVGMPLSISKRAWRVMNSKLWFIKKWHERLSFASAEGKRFKFIAFISSVFFYPSWGRAALSVGAKYWDPIILQLLIIKSLLNWKSRATEILKRHNKPFGLLAET